MNGTALSAKSNPRRGAVMVIVMMIMTAAMLMSMVSVQVATTDLKLSRNYKSGAMAFYAAEAGLEKAISQLRLDRKWADGMSVTDQVNGTTYEVAVEPVNCQLVRLLSIGYAGNTRRMIQTTINVDCNFDHALNVGGDITLTGKPRISAEGVRVNGNVQMTLDSGTNGINIYAPGSSNISCTGGSGSSPPASAPAAGPSLVDLPLSQKSSGGSVVICHIPPGNPSKQKTMTIPVSALGGHLGHGDHLGPCGPSEPDDDEDDDDADDDAGDDDTSGFVCSGQYVGQTCGTLNRFTTMGMDLNAARLTGEHWKELRDMASSGYRFDSDGQMSNKDSSQTFTNLDFNSAPVNSKGQRVIFVDGDVTLNGALSGIGTLVATGNITASNSFVASGTPTVSFISKGDVLLNFDTNAQSQMNGMVFAEGDFEMHGKISYTGVVTCLGSANIQNPSSFTNNSDPNYWVTYSAGYSAIADPVDLMAWQELTP